MKFGLPVRLGSVRAGGEVVPPRKGAREVPGPDVVLGVIGRDLVDRDPQSAEVLDHPGEEARAGLAAFVPVALDVGEAAVVVDRHVQVVVTGAGTPGDVPAGRLTAPAPAPAFGTRPSYFTSSRTSSPARARS